ncbi:MAG: hypothetical protein GVY06_03245 [Alphaproteobacteria bacterium]|nr:hypothetical protein [Alphaproteobacteria bacterium]
MAEVEQAPAFSELYSAYAAGCLDPSFALLVETQAALRNDISEAIAVGEAISGLFLEAEAPARMTDGALERAFAAIDAEAPVAARRHAAKAAGEALAEIIALPEPLREVALDAAGDSGWKMVAPGLKRLKLDTGGLAESELFRIGPGISVPRHTHEGNEYTLVVAGGFTDGSGSYGPGDLAVKSSVDTHQPVADEDGACIALAVRDGGLKFTGAMGLVQRLLGG